jgi:hypothetical protein
MLEYSYNSLVLYIILSLSLTNFYFNWIIHYSYFPKVKKCIPHIFHIPNV